MIPWHIIGRDREVMTDGLPWLNSHHPLYIL